MGYKLLQRSGLKEWWSGRLNVKRVLRLLLACLPIVLFSLLSTAYPGWSALLLTSPEAAAALTALASYLSGLFLTYGVPTLSQRLRLNREPSKRVCS